ncbi:hypothetical protein [Tateyamaria sp.]|uniref:hypothetical protein n=1 Tax=Tateyamaria sp. TaxID=1929288 RepID=UPI003B21EE20
MKKACQLLIVRHGFLPEREVMTGIGKIAVQVPRRPRSRARMRIGSTDPELHIEDRATLT